MNVISDGKNKFRVIANDGTILAEDLSNSDAWRFVDRHEGEPINHAQRESDWFWKNISVAKNFEGGFHEYRPGIPRRDEMGNVLVPERK